MTPDDFKRIATEIAEKKAYTSEFAADIEKVMRDAWQEGFIAAATLPTYVSNVTIKTKLDGVDLLRPIEIDFNPQSVDEMGTAEKIARELASTLFQHDCRKP